VTTGRARTRIRQRLREIGELEPLDGQIRRHVADESPPPPKRIKHEVDDATREKLIRIEGGRGFAVVFAKCCNPMPGQPIIGYVTRDTGITVHKADCKNFTISKRDPARIVEAGWAGDSQFETTIRVLSGQRPNMIADLTTAMRPMNVNILAANYVLNDDGQGEFEFVFEAEDRDSVERIRRTLATVSGVAEVTVLPDRKVRDAKAAAQAYLEQQAVS
jgi:GTP pyrophosphokinase